MSIRERFSVILSEAKNLWLTANYEILRHSVPQNDMHVSWFEYGH